MDSELGTDPDELSEIEEANARLKEELDKWEEIKVDPNEAVVFNMVVMDAYLTVIGQLLVEQGIIEDEELTLKLKQRMLENLQSHRQVVEDRLLAIRMEGIIVPNLRMDVPRNNNN